MHHAELIRKLITGERVLGVEKDPLESADNDNYYEQTNKLDFKPRESPFMRQTDKDPILKTDKTEKSGED